MKFIMTLFAISFCFLCCKASPDNPINYNDGKKYYENNEYPFAIVSLEKALSKERGLINIFEAEEMLDDAREKYAKQLFDAGIKLKQAGHFNEAAKKINNAYNLHHLTKYKLALNDCTGNSD